LTVKGHPNSAKRKKEYPDKKQRAKHKGHLRYPLKGIAYHRGRRECETITGKVAHDLIEHSRPVEQPAKPEYLYDR
jgi:hypothetical protein